MDMSRIGFTSLAVALIASAFVSTAQAQAQTPARPQFATTKVEGTDNVYIFRYENHQSMFIVTKAGVIATDPISLRRPAAKAYIEEIRKITQAPIKFVIYSHSHYDHIAGGQPFKDLGATFIAHKNAKARIVELKPADVVVPDEVVDKKKVIQLGGTTLELLYVGRNHYLLTETSGGSATLKEAPSRQAISFIKEKRLQILKQ
jgi:glyoxylase-like metal-dependent hydrolase (beta-lactamase superfamily II)